MKHAWFWTHCVIKMGARYLVRCHFLFFFCNALLPFPRHPLSWKEKSECMAFSGIWRCESWKIRCHFLIYIVLRSIAMCCAVRPLMIRPRRYLHFHCFLFSPLFECGGATFGVMVKVRCNYTRVKGISRGAALILRAARLQAGGTIGKAICKCLRAPANQQRPLSCPFNLRRSSSWYFRHGAGLGLS